MATITIIDSGFVSASETGTQETLISNNGSAITLKSVNLSYQTGQQIDNTPVAGTEKNTTLNPVSSTNPILTIQGTLNRTDSADMAKIILFDTLRRSKGIKLLYYNSTADDVSAGGVDGWDTVIQKLGVDNVDGNTNQDGDTVSDKHTQSGGELFNSGAPFPHLHVFVKGVRIPQNGESSLLRYTLTCEVT